MSNETFFEHPLNERIRTFLRLEHLFEKVEFFRYDPSPWATRAAIDGLLDIIAITGRSDIKSELIKEIERNLATLNRMRRQPQVDTKTLNEIVHQLEDDHQGLMQMIGPIGATTRDHELLKSIAQRSSIPGGACSFDLPFYHYLLTKPIEQRTQQIKHWMIDLEPVSDAIGLILSLARTSASPRSIVAHQGFFQEAVDSSAPAQLLRIGLEPSLPFFPEISGHKNRFSIRFLTSVNEATQRPIQTSDDIAFTLTCCVF